MKKVPMRRCMACMESKPKNQLYRIVKTNDDIVFFDPTGKMSGRGTYICSIDCLDKAIKTKRISNQLQISISENTYNKIKDDIIAYIK